MKRGVGHGGQGEPGTPVVDSGSMKHPAPLLTNERANVLSGMVADRVWREGRTSNFHRLVAESLNTREALMRHLRELLECHDVLNVKAGGGGHGSHPQTRTLLHQLRGEDA